MTLTSEVSNEISWSTLSILDKKKKQKNKKKLSEKKRKKRESLWWGEPMRQFLKVLQYHHIDSAALSCLGEIGYFTVNFLFQVKLKWIC